MACDITFADVHGVKCTLHAYAEQPLHLCGQQVFVFQKCAKLEGSVEEESAAECCHCEYSDTVSPTSLGLVQVWVWVRVQVQVREYISIWHM